MSDDKDLRLDEITSDDDNKTASENGANSSADVRSIESIDELLRAFKAQKDDSIFAEDENGEIEPPKIYSRVPADIASQDIGEEIVTPKKASKFKKPDINYKKLIKSVGIVALVVAVAVGGTFGVRSYIQNSKTEYLKPYEKKYPGVAFPVGIMEKYCDTFGKHPTSVGYISISDTDLSAPVLSGEEDAYPYAEKNEDGFEQVNYVVYLTDNSLEEYYGCANAYNEKASGHISYSDLYDEYRFEIVGAFYTNTLAEDDDGYIFPYNVTEKMTPKSTASYLDRLQTRFIYDVGITVTSADKLLIISSPTDYRENFRFVVVGILRNDSSDKPTATENTRTHYPQVIYNETGEENPYRFASDWYPELLATDEDGNEVTKQHGISDYETK